MKFPLQSHRLTFRPFSPEDAHEFFRLNHDPEVIKYTGDPPFASVEEARTFLQAYAEYKIHGYGRWIVLRSETGEWLGWCGLKFSQELNETDLGFRFHRKFWGQGFATEAARACLQFGFEKLGLERIVGRAMQANAGSLRVLEKVGMKRIGEFEFERHPGVLYEILRQHWEG